MQLDPVQTAVAVLASVFRGTPNDAHLDTLVNELDRLRADVAAAEEGAYRHGHIDGRAHAFAEMEQRARTEPVRDHAAAERSRLDDLARDVARAVAAAPGYPMLRPYDRYSILGEALDRLVAAYLPDGPKDTPR